MTKSVLFYTISSAGNDGANYIPTANLTSSTNIHFQRFYPDSVNVINIRWFVITFASGVSVQRGSLDIAAGTQSGTASITTVDINKTVLIAPGGRQSRSSYGCLHGYPIGYFSSSSQLTFTWPIYDFEKVVEWQVLEFV
jgi:hypothetical protein